MEALGDRIRALGERASRLEARRDMITERISQFEQEIAQCESEDLLLDQVVRLFRHMLQLYVYSYAESFGDVITEGLQSVFADQDLTFRIDVIEKRGKIHVQFVTTHNGIEGDVLQSFGGGVSAIQSLLLRVMVLLRAGLAPYLFLDESLAALSKEYVPSAGEFLRALCHELGVNILLVTHQQDFLDYADRAYRAVWSEDTQSTVLRKIR